VKLTITLPNLDQAHGRKEEGKKGSLSEGRRKKKKKGLPVTDSSQLAKPLSNTGGKKGKKKREEKNSGEKGKRRKER